MTSKTTFCKKVNLRKYPLQICTYIGEDLEFIIHIFYWCIPLYHEIYTSGRIKHLTWLKIYLVTLRSLIDLHLLIFRKLSTQDILIPHPCGYLSSENVPARTSLNLDSNLDSNLSNISPNIFRLRLSFVWISEAIAL